VEPPTSIEKASGCIERCEGAPRPHIAAQIKSLYELSFPAHERVAWEDILGAATRGDAQVFVATTEGGVSGFAVTRRLTDTSGHLLQYLAVRPELRNSGKGGALLDVVVESLTTRNRGDVLLIEVEHPADPQAPDRVNRERRLRFYERHDAQVVACAPQYRAPNLAAVGTVPYVLLWIPLHGDADEPRGTALRTAIREIFETTYGNRHSEPILRDVLADLLC
jgi:ribosomal protein S18 acetylase RimI-like enzyme